MAHLLMYSTNYTVCRRSACLCPRAESALAAPRDRKLVPPPAFTLPARFISVFQVAEAFTTSKGRVGRRLLECSDLSEEICITFWNPFGRDARVCERIGFEDACDGIVDGVTAIADAANALKEVAESAANALKEVAESALDAVTGWFDDLGRDIQCVRAPSNPRSSPR